MPNSFGYRARTRDMFKRGFKQRGMIKLSTFMKPYKVGDYVDIKANGAQQKGMPHKFYHGYVLDRVLFCNMEFLTLPHLFLDELELSTTLHPAPLAS
ncbi:hypothetical protein FRC14_001464 [Serendipita sp. 396]|nr:hypothetical protein FRC14_001464 [Serendipita sp. 396]